MKEPPTPIRQSFLKSENIFPQPAVEALSEREAQLALRNEIENGNMDDFIDSDDFDWNNGKKVKDLFLSCEFLLVDFWFRTYLDWLKDEKSFFITAWQMI